VRLNGRARSQHAVEIVASDDVSQNEYACEQT